MTTAAQQTEAQQIASELAVFATWRDDYTGTLGRAAAELRRLDAENEFLKADRERMERNWNKAQPAQQPVNAELLEALQQARAEIWRLLDAKGIDPKQARQWPEIIILEAAIAKTTGETK